MSRYFDDATIVTVNCRRCGQVGHKTSECTKDYLELSRCLLCAQSGHLVSHCPLRARGTPRVHHPLRGDHSEDGAICLVCGEVDHVNCKYEIDDDARSISQSCAKCGEKDHNELDCSRGRHGSRSGSSHTGRRSEHRDEGRRRSSYGQPSKRSNAYDEDDRKFFNRRRSEPVQSRKRQRIW